MTFKEMEQYHFEREEFCNVFKKVFTNDKTLTLDELESEFVKLKDDLKENGRIVLQRV